MINKEKIYIIIPVHNRKEFTHHCLLSLYKQTDKNFIIVIIDDGSIDGTEKMIINEFPEVILLKGDGDLWWTKATNLGVKFALDHRAEYILTLNNDTLLAEDYIEKMVYWSKKKKDALLGSLTLDIKSQKPIYGGEIINWKKVNSQFLLNTLTQDQYVGLHKVSHFPGRGLLIPSQVFLKIGYYDKENFPHYGADYDFTHRALRNGFEIYCNFDAKLYTYSEESGDYQNRKNKSIVNYFLHLFGRKGGGNIKIFIKYAVKNCPRRYLPTFITIGILKRIFGYLWDWFKEIFLIHEVDN